MQEARLRHCKIRFFDCSGKHPQALYVKNSNELSMMISGSGYVKVYLGDYLVGQIENEENFKGFYFSKGYTQDESLCGSIASKLRIGGFISNKDMNNIIKNGVGLEKFLECAYGDANVVITADPKISMILIQSGFIMVCRLREIGGVTSFWGDDFEERENRSESIYVRTYMEDVLKWSANKKGRVKTGKKQKYDVWFAAPLENTFKENRRERALNDISTAYDLKKYVINNPGIPYVRMFIGNYEIGGISWSCEKQFYIVRDVYGSEHSFSNYIDNFFPKNSYQLSGKSIDDIIFNKTTIGDFFKLFNKDCGAYYNNVVLVDSPEKYEVMVEKGYKALLTLNTLLIDPAEKFKHRDDIRVVMVS